jgi:hypothetical protein
LARADTLHGHRRAHWRRNTKLFTGENPKSKGRQRLYCSGIGGTNPDGSPRRITTMFYLREISTFQKHAQEHGGGIGGVLAGGKDMLLSKMLFEPIHELWNNRNYFGSEIWDTNASGFQQLMQALHHVWTGQLSPMSVSGAQRAEESMGVEPKWYPTTKEGALSYLGFGPAPK